MSARTVDGFTLVETLVTLVLLGLISSLTVGVFQQLRSARAIETRYQEVTEVSAALAYMTGELGLALPIPLSGGDTDIQQPLIGTPTSVRFVGVTHNGFRSGALREIEFAVEERQNRKALVRRTKSRSNTEEAVEELLTDITNLKFEYRVTSDDNAWISEWQRCNFLPTAVRMTTTFSNVERYTATTTIR